MDQTIATGATGAFCDLFLLGPSLVCIRVKPGELSYTSVPYWINPNLRTAKNRVTSILTSVLSALCCLGLAAMSIWFAFERWIFDWHNGNKLLSDVLSEVAHGVSQVRVIAWVLDQYHRTATVNRRVARKGSPALRSLKKLLVKLLYSEDASLDQASTIGDPAPSTYTMEAHFVTDIEAQNSNEGGITAPSDDPLPSGKERFVLLVRKIMDTQRATRSMRTRRPTNGTIPRVTRRHFTGMSDLSVTVPSGTIATLVPKLKTLDVVRTLETHTGLVRDIQFSPDGEFLVTTGWDDEMSVSLTLLTLSLAKLDGTSAQWYSQSTYANMT